MTSISLTSQKKDFPIMTAYLQEWEKRYASGDSVLTTEEIKDIYDKHGYKPFYELRENNVDSALLVDIINELPLKARDHVQYYFMDNQSLYHRIEQANKSYRQEIPIGSSMLASATKDPRRVPNYNYLLGSFDNLAQNAYLCSKLGVFGTRLFSLVPGVGGRAIRLLATDMTVSASVFYANQLAPGVVLNSLGMNANPRFYWNENEWLPDATIYQPSGFELYPKEISRLLASRINVHPVMADEGAWHYSDALYYFYNQTYSMLNYLIAKKNDEDKEYGYPPSDVARYTEHLSGALNIKQSPAYIFLGLLNWPVYESLYSALGYYLFKGYSTKSLDNLFRTPAFNITPPQISVYGGSRGFFINTSLGFKRLFKSYNSAILSYGFEAASHKDRRHRLGADIFLDDFSKKSPITLNPFFYLGLGGKEFQGLFGMKAEYSLGKNIALNAGLAYNHKDYLATEIKSLPEKGWQFETGMKIFWKER